MKKFLPILFFCTILATSYSQKNNFEISREFTLFTSQQLSGYLKPLFTSIEESLNSGLYSTANYSNGWSFGIDISASGMFIPRSHRSYDAVLPDKYGDISVVKNAQLANRGIINNLKGTSRQPTIYGGMSYPIFAAPQNAFPPDSFYKSVAFVEGNDIDFMSGIPQIQFIIGIPTRTQIKFRYLQFPMQKVDFIHYSIGINQNIDKLTDLFTDSSYALALNFAYHKFQRSPGIDLSSYSFGAHFSKSWDIGFTAYLGLQFEDMSGNFFAVREINIDKDIINNPYPEIRDGKPLDISIDNYNKFRLGGGLSYKYGIIELNSFAYYAAQPIVGAGLSLWFLDFVPQTDTIIPEPEPITIPEPQIVEISKPEIPDNPIYYPDIVLNIEDPKSINKTLKAELNTFGIENGKEEELLKIKVEERISRRMSPLLPIVFFDHNSYEIPKRYIKLTKDDAENYQKPQIAAGNALDNYYNVLNIIGSRMKAYPKAKLKITGTNSGIADEKNNKNLSQNRAQAIRDYLVNIWNIDPERLSVSSRNLPEKASSSKVLDGVEENRRVEFASDTWEVTAPSILQDTMRIVNPPSIRFKPEVIASEGIDSWKINTISGPDLINNINGKSNISAYYDWHINSDIAAKSLLKSDFASNLSVTDNSGETYSTNLKKLPVEVKTYKNDDSESKDTIRNIYDLILFDFDKAALSGDNQKIINLIKQETPPGAIINVRGFTDRMGDDKYNKTLSTRRAASTAKALKSPANAYGVGEEIQLYNNNLPEGRFYSRTVIVEVKIPVNKGDQK